MVPDQTPSPGRHRRRSTASASLRRRSRRSPNGSSPGTSGHVGGGGLSIGALSRASGIPVETLRTWERRYGFPIPERKPSGHRVYAVADLPRLSKIAAALARGHRAGEVVPASERDLDALLDAGPAVAGEPIADLLEIPTRKGAEPTGPFRSAPVDLSSLMKAIREADSPRLTRMLLLGWGRVGPVQYFEQYLAPLLGAVGSAWQEGKLDIGHEHFFSERLSDLLRSLRLPYEDRAQGPLVVLATLPGEEHQLALQMAALIVSAAGCRILYLGAGSPPEDIASIARDLRAAAVAISISALNRGAVMEAGLLELRKLLPPATTLLVGGEGAAELPGVLLMERFTQLDSWARKLASSPRARGRRGRPTQVDSQHS